MTKSRLVYLILAVVVWTCLSLIEVGRSRESFGVYVASVGLSALVGACLAFALQRRSREIGGALGEYLVSLFGRTAVPLGAVAVALTHCDESVRREIAVRVLIGYFGCVPFHVWVTIPSKKEVDERAKS